MKIEKVNDRTIRCTLTKSDLMERKIKLSELAYGTEKARGFFKDMIQQASYQFGFEAEDIPLMIEAIPLSGEAIVLVITKVEDPEELDTRFSRFAPDLKDGTESQEDSGSRISSYGADDVIDLVKRLHDTIQTANRALKEDQGEPLKELPLKQDGGVSKRSAPSAGEKNIQITVPVDIVKLYSFKELNTIQELSRILKGLYNGQNTLYKDSMSGLWYLLVRKSNLSPEIFNKVGNIITEYGHTEEYSPSVQAWYNEHGDAVIWDSALQTLAEL